MTIDFFTGDLHQIHEAATNFGAGVFATKTPVTTADENSRE
jgi:hypothetical protein